MDTIAEGIAYLRKFKLKIGHNSIKYDHAVLVKLFGEGFKWQEVRDTLVLSKLVWADIVSWDMEQRKKPGNQFPGQLTGRYSLEAWGQRMGFHKASYEGDTRIEDEAERKRLKWAEWNQDMEDYGVQDAKVTLALWNRVKAKEWSEESILIETQVAWILARQERYGFLFDQRAAVDLYGTLVQRKVEMERELQAVFKPRYRPDGVNRPWTPKRDSKQHGYSADAPLTKVKLVEFSPSSREHVAVWLKAMRGWKPVDFTPDGGVQVDEAILAKLPYPEAKVLREYYIVEKRIGQVAEGNQAWLKKVNMTDGRMHGSVDTMGTITGRMSHSHPNMGQVPASYSPYGKECRALFIVPKGKVLVGADADALELRDMAGYMAAWDDGAYIDVVLKGDKKLGTDIHSVNARALGLDPTAVYFDGETGRDIAKTWFYAFLYGAGDEKLGFTLTRKQVGARAAGKRARDSFMANLPALGALVKAVKAKAKAQKWLKGLDGRRIAVRSEHAALNTLLQCAGAVQMKKAICIFDDTMQAAGYAPGKQYELVAVVHDEAQIEVDEGLEEFVGKTMVEAIRQAGEYFKFRCPLDGEWKAGKSWYATH
ncbi:DNA polymerase [Variovorax sp. RKNM96]|nr:DNA polymerase [Variovorax sp. RKNM96]